MMLRVRRARRPSALTVAIVGPLVSFTAFSVVRSERRIVAYLVVWTVCAAGVTAVHRRWPLSRALIWALVASGWLHLAGGLLPSPDAGAPIFYETWLVDGLVKVDQLFHAAICAAVTVAAFQVIRRLVDPRQATAGVCAAIAAIVCWGLGAANELFEFLSALRFEDSYAGGLDNAGWDLAYNTAGSTAAAIACALLARPGPDPRGTEPPVAGSMSRPAA